MDKQNEYNYQKDELLSRLESNNLGILINVVLKSDLHKKVVFELMNESELYEGETIKEKLLNLIFFIEGNGAINTMSELTHYNDSDKIFELYRSDISDYIYEKDEQDGYAKDVLRHIISDDMLLTDSYTRNRVLGFIFESIADDIKVILEY